MGKGTDFIESKTFKAQHNNRKSDKQAKSIKYTNIMKQEVKNVCKVIFDQETIPSIDVKCQ